MMRLLPVLLLAAIQPVWAADPADAPVDSLIWVNETAAADSLSNYWRNLEDDWYTPLTPEDLDQVLSVHRLDSLTSLGDVTLRGMLDGRPWRLDFHTFAGLHYNRVEGLAPSIGVTLDRPGLRQPEWTLRSAYGFAWKRATLESGLRVPLATRRLRDPDGRLTADPWTSLALTAEGGRTTRWFGGDRRFERELEAMFNGEDPSHYYEQRWWEARLEAKPFRRLTVTAGIGGADDRALDTTTRSSLFGEAEDVWDNLRVPEMVRRSILTSATWRTHAASLGVQLDWHRVTDGPADLADGDVRWYRSLRAQGRLTHRDPMHNEWVLRGEYSSVDRQAPMQWKTWLGDWGTLRGFEAAELVGDRGGWVSLDTRWNVDLFKTLRIPLLNKLGLQPITFVEAGRTWNADGPEAPWTEPGWRADAGFGFGRLMGLGDRGPESLRMYVARPVGQNRDDEPWRVVVAMEWW